jgi:arabinogalactan endo-1,4-beta-galactosidase
MASRIHQQGMKVWLSVHFSDTWADPGTQTKPLAWQNLSFTVLNDSVNSYMTHVMNAVQPEIVQIGNETNDGLLWPEGKLSTNESQSLLLMQTAINAVRAIQPNSKIILHYGGLNGASWFFGKVQQLDYDYIGLSYYPVWHGTSLNNLESTITNLASTFDKKVIIAETAYPFTLSWNDWTNNIVGLQNQLIPGYDASPSGQLQYLTDIKNWSKQSSVCKGFCYWGGEWVSFQGPQATNGSSWENQALWDFNNNALPAINAFNAN